MQDTWQMFSLPNWSHSPCFKNPGDGGIKTHWFQLANVEMFPLQTDEMHLHIWAWLHFCVRERSPQACLGSREFTGGVSSPNASLVMAAKHSPQPGLNQSGSNPSLHQTGLLAALKKCSLEKKVRKGKAHALAIHYLSCSPKLWNILSSLTGGNSLFQGWCSPHKQFLMITAVTLIGHAFHNSSRSVRSTTTFKKRVSSLM